MIWRDPPVLLRRRSRWGRIIRAPGLAWRLYRIARRPPSVSRRAALGVAWHGVRFIVR